MRDGRSVPLDEPVLVSSMDSRKGDRPTGHVYRSENAGVKDMCGELRVRRGPDEPDEGGHMRHRRKKGMRGAVVQPTKKNRRGESTRSTTDTAARKECRAAAARKRGR